jgi:hypothetical protein
MKIDAQEFVGALFSARDYAHSAHLNTDSFAQHMALNAFYDEIFFLSLFLSFELEQKLFRNTFDTF